MRPDVMSDSSAIDFGKLRVTVGALTDRLAQRDYEGAILLALGSRLGPSELERTIQDYDESLVPLPALAFEVIDVAPLSDTSPQQWSILVPLWTQEGRS